MTIISINQLLQINQTIEEQQLPFKIHLRDACGKQSLWVEEFASNTDSSLYDSLYKILDDFSKNERFTFEYSSDKKTFWIN